RATKTRIVSRYSVSPHDINKLATRRATDTFWLSSDRLTRGLRSPLGPAHDSDLAARASSAEEPIAAIGLESRHADSARHLEDLENFARPGIDAPHVAVVTFPGAVPELAVDPGDPGDEAIGGDRAKNRAGFRIDLMDLPVAILADPERPFGPREPRVTAAT